MLILMNSIQTLRPFLPNMYIYIYVNLLMFDNMYIHVRQKYQEYKSSPGYGLS